MATNTSSLSLRRTFLYGAFFIGILVLGAVLRAPRLSDRPMHNDEGVNAWFLMNLVRDNSYAYDPENYHGPLLYYFQLPPTWARTLQKVGIRKFSFKSIEGLDDVSLRGTMVVVGLFLLAALWFARPFVGRFGVLASMFLLATSPTAIYYSRYFIHEIYFVFFTLTMVLGFLAYVEGASGAGLGVGFLSAVFLFSTKETSVITFGVVGLAALAADLVVSKSEGIKIWDAMKEAWKRVDRAGNDLAGRGFSFFIAGVAAWVLLYSSFFTNRRGLLDSFRTYAKWTKESVHSGHNKPFLYFMDHLLWPYEKPLLFLGFVGLVVAFRRLERKSLFVAFWALGILFVYSFIPYKTPWLALNMLLPLALLAGVGIEAFVEEGSLGSSSKAGACLFVLGLSLLNVPKVVKVNYRFIDADPVVHSYVHTSRDVVRLVERLKEIGRQTGDGDALPVNVLAKEYWPLPYYLRFHSQVIFTGRLDTGMPLETPVIIADKDQVDDLKKRLGARYSVEKFALRSNCQLYVFFDTRYPAAH